MTFSQSVERKAQSTGSFHSVLNQRIDDFVDSLYVIARQFPSDEAFGATSQLKRAALSIALNYHEGHGRFSDKARTQYIRISFGSLRECLYLVDFSCRQKFISTEQKEQLKEKGLKIYAMFWGILRKR